MTYPVRFPERTEVYILPIRYWESEFPIVKGIVTKENVSDKKFVYIHAENETQSMYYPMDRVYYKLENAEKVRTLKCALYHIDFHDSTSVIVDKILEEVDAEKRQEEQ